MKSTYYKFPDRLIHNTNSETDLLSAFLQEYAHKTVVEPDPEDKQASEITYGIQKLNQILKEMTLPGKKNFMEEWMTAEQLRLKLNISERTLASWRKSGKLPYSRIEQKLYYKIQDVENLLTAQYRNNHSR